MAATAALLGTLLCTNADITYYTQQQIFWANKYEANAAKLQDWTKKQEDWHEKHDDLLYGDKDKTIGSVTYYCGNENDAIEYANDKIGKDIYTINSIEEELSFLDMEYETMKLMYETQLEALRAQQESEKTATSTAAQDTGLLSG